MRIQGLTSTGIVGEAKIDGDALKVSPLRISGEDPDSDYLATSNSGYPARIGNTTTPQVVKSAPGIVQRVIINTGVANATITLRDGPSADVAVITVPDTAFRVIELGLVFTSDIRVVPNNTGLNFTVVWR